MAVTLKDIADKVGVHISTVSRVLNNRGYISEDLRAKVDEAIKELNYHPNVAARALFQKKSYILGLIVPDVSIEFFGRLCRAAEEAAYARGYEMLVCNSELDAAKEKRYMDLLMADQVDGIVFASHTIDTTAFSSINLPVVSVERMIDTAKPYIIADNYKGGKLAAEHLLANGCRKPAIICGHLKLNMAANDRYRAFSEVMDAHGVSVIMRETDIHGFDIQNYQRLILRLLEENPDIDAIFATSDLIAAYALRICKLRNYRVPEDIQIIGFDGTRFGQMLMPALTSVGVPVEDIGKEAVNVLIEMIENGKKVNKVFDVVFRKGETTK